MILKNDSKVLVTEKGRIDRRFQSIFHFIILFVLHRHRALKLIVRVLENLVTYVDRNADVSCDLIPSVTCLILLLLESVVLLGITDEELCAIFMLIAIVTK